MVKSPFTQYIALQGGGREVGPADWLCPPNWLLHHPTSPCPQDLLYRPALAQ